MRSDWPDALPNGGADPFHIQNLDAPVILKSGKSCRSPAIPGRASALNVEPKSGLRSFPLKTLHTLRQEGVQPMSETTYYRIGRTVRRYRRLSATSPLIFFGLLLAAPPLHAQLPAGTTDATAQPQPTPQDP